ncbi:MAG: hypothetical protein KAU22_07750 [Desulfuromonadales bacterium]|nr:hypothetical protein [Desulfuromonadales bacterium]
MICGFCHRQIEIKIGALEDGSACGSCFGGCRKVHCPHCGYANPAPGKLLARFLQLKKGNDSD